MKSKFFNSLALSLATSILLLSVNKAIAQGVAQTNPELQPLTFDIDSNSSSQSTKISKHEQATNSTSATSSSQINHLSVGATDQVSNPLGGLFVTFVFIVYILVGLRYRKQRLQRATILLQQIETLERIWNMQSH